MQTVRFTQVIPGCSAWDFGMAFRDHLEDVVGPPLVPNIKEVRKEAEFPTVDGTTVSVYEWTSHLYDIPFFLRPFVRLMVNPKLWSWTEVKEWDTTNPSHIKVEFGAYQYVSNASTARGPVLYMAALENHQAHSPRLQGAAMQGAGEMVIQDTPGGAQFTMTNVLALDPAAAGLPFLSRFASGLEADIAKKIKGNTRDLVVSVADFAKKNPGLNPRPMYMNGASPVAAVTPSGAFRSCVPLGHGTFSKGGGPVEFTPAPGAGAPHGAPPILGRR